MADSTTTRFQVRGSGRAEMLPPRAGRAFQGRSMTSGPASTSWPILGRVAGPCWNVGSSRPFSDFDQLSSRMGTRILDAKSLVFTDIKERTGLGSVEPGH
jgi:hypothetical protein